MVNSEEKCTRSSLLGRYEIGRTLGEGNFGKVKYARHLATGAHFAVKILDRNKILSLRCDHQIRREIGTLKLLKHPNVVRLHEVAESWSRSLEKSRRGLQQEQVGVDKTKTMDAYIETGVITSQQLAQEDIVFTVTDEPWFKLKQLRYLNNLHGSLVIDGLENVKSGEEALEANLAAKERLTKLVLKWDYSGAPCPEVQAQVLEGLCPHVGLKKLEISCYEGSRYPAWMVGKQNGGPKDLQELDLHTFVKGPAPQFVESFPHLRVPVLSCGSWEALPSNMEQLTSLKKLVLNRNYIIRSLPTLPQSLEEFHVIYCDHIFMKSCVKAGHPNWHQIEHIPKKTFKDDSVTLHMVCLLWIRQL